MKVAEVIGDTTIVRRKARNSAMLVVLQRRQACTCAEVECRGLCRARLSLLRSAQHWKIMFRTVPVRVIPARPQVPGLLAGRLARTGTMRADARPLVGLKPAHEHAASTAAHGVSTLELGHSWCARL